jgi:hypothetical protein
MHTRRRFGVAVLGAAALALILGGAGQVHAGFITWGGAQNITGDADVKTDGALFGALNIGAPGVSNATVNMVTFQAAAVTNPLSDTFGQFQFNAAGGGFLATNSLGSSGAFFTSLSSGYQSLLSSGLHDNAGFTLTISGLTVGDQYEFEWWNNTIPEAQPIIARRPQVMVPGTPSR